MKDDPFGDAIKRALNRDPWAIPGKKEEPAEETPPALEELPLEVGDMWGKLCPVCRCGWTYYAPVRLIACFGVRWTERPDYSIPDEPDGCGAKWRTCE